MRWALLSIAVVSLAAAMATAADVEHKMSSGKARRATFMAESVNLSSTETSEGTVMSKSYFLRKQHTKQPAGTLTRIMKGQDMRENPSEPSRKAQRAGEI